jgi:hypothetical protein
MLSTLKPFVFFRSSFIPKKIVLRLQDRSQFRRNFVITNLNCSSDSLKKNANFSNANLNSKSISAGDFIV